MGYTAPPGNQPVRRSRAYLEFIAAVVYYFFARLIANHAANGLAADAWIPLVEQCSLLLLLLVVYSSFGRAFDRQAHPLAEQGLPRRRGWRAEIALGAAVGWGAALACVLPLTLVGGIAIVLSTQREDWGWLLVDLLFFAVMAMAEEVAFRGYAFQRFVSVAGSFGATLGFALFYAGLQAFAPGSSKLSFAVSFVFAVVLTICYLRTRALWLGWGLNFAWKGSRALIFGLTVSGVGSHSPVVEGDPMGPFWMTGGGFGLDGSWIAFFVCLIAIPVVYRLTRDLDYQHNAPVIVPAGMAVDLDAAARRQHEAAMGPAEPAASALVQIWPAAAPVTVPARTPIPAGPENTTTETTGMPTSSPNETR